MSDLIKLDNIGKRNGDIKAFATTSNIIKTKTGISGWGSVEIAIDNNSVGRLVTEELIGVLYLVSKKDWEEEGKSYQK